jgi:hypothetical protein
MWILIFTVLFIVILGFCFISKERFATNPMSYYDIAWTDPNPTGDTYNVQIQDTSSNTNVFTSQGQTAKNVDFGKDCNPLTDENCGKWSTPYLTTVVATENGLNSTPATMNFVSGSGPKNPVGAFGDNVFIDVQWCEGSPSKCYRVD